MAQVQGVSLGAAASGVPALILGPFVVTGNFM
jgi:hypothetical protein